MKGETMMFRTLVFSAVLGLAACTDTGDDAGLQGNHVWKTQTDMLDKARDVEGMIMEGSQQRGRSIDEQAR
jgi:hypothetical protein